jgi:hypothetical protein
MDVADEAITNDQEIGHLNNNISSIVQSKILNHFIKGKIALSPMEIIFTILRELELLENLVKLVRNKHNEGLKIINLTKVEVNHVVRKFNIHKNHRKTLHLPVEINNNLIERLVDIGASMLVHDILSQPHFGLSVRVKPTLPKVGSWSPPGLPKTQSSIAGVKSPRI